MNRPLNGRRLRSALVALTITAATAGTTVATAGSASAAATCTTKTVITAKSSTASRVAVKWGDYFALEVNVTPTCSDGNTYTAAGTIKVQKSTNGGSTWTGVASDYASSAYWQRAGTNWNTRTAIFRAIYTGATDGSARTYSSSSDSVGIGMYRASKIGSYKNVRGGLRVNYAITPATSIKGLYVKFQVKRDGRWRGYKKVRATSTGHAIAIFAGSSKGIHYRANFPSARGFIASSSAFTVTRY